MISNKAKETKHKESDAMASLSSTVQIENYDQSSSQQIQRRVKALKKLQFEKLKIDSELTCEILALETKFTPKYEPLLQKRAKIISGEHEPNDEECDFGSEEEECLASLVMSKLKIRESNGLKGIPGYWLIAMKNDDDLSDWIELHDEPPLMHLTDIRSRRVTPLKLILEFDFAPNDYFTNRVLSKEYQFRCGPDPNDPWNLQAFAIIDCKGCRIDWKDGQNVTKLRVVDHKSREHVMKRNSFFDFFDPPKVGDIESDAKVSEQLENDWSIGKLFYSSFVPNSVLYFTGDIFEDYSDSESESTESSESSSASQSGSSGISTSDSEDSSGSHTE